MTAVRWSRDARERLSIVLPPLVCIDCDDVVRAGRGFLVVPPRHRREGGGRPFWICEACWDQLNGDSTC